MNQRQDNPWLPYNERIRDFIRWYELGYYIIIYSVGFVLWGWWGILGVKIFNWLMYGMGGPLVDFFGEYPEPPEPLPNRCSAGIKNCQICDNEYDHEFNLNYKKEGFIKSLGLPFI